jgi:hypothetical protein
VATKTREKMRAREAVVVVVGARPIEYQKRIVRDRHTHKLVEIDLHEAPPVDEGGEGISYVFKRDEEVWSDHPAVLDAPGCFLPADEPRSD